MTAHLEIVDGRPRLIAENGEKSDFLSREQMALLLSTAGNAHHFNIIRQVVGKTFPFRERVGGVEVTFGADRATLVFITDAAAWLTRQLGDDPRDPWRGQDTI